MKYENISYINTRKCCGCNETFRYKACKNNIYKIGEKTIQKTRDFFENPEIKLNDLICNVCRKKVLNNKTPNSIVNKKSPAYRNKT